MINGKTWTLYRRPALPKGLRIGRGGVNWASAGFCPMINFKAPKLSRKDRLVFVMLPSEGNRSRPQLYVNVRGGELLKILETNIQLGGCRAVASRSLARPEGNLL
ncbi:hypothetical protein AUP68_14024 [Ilyonectria robusta]